MRSQREDTIAIILREYVKSDVCKSSTNPIDDEAEILNIAGLTSWKFQESSFTIWCGASKCHVLLV